MPIIMKKITIIIIVLGLLLGGSLLKLFTASVIIGARDCLNECPEGFDTAIRDIQKVNFWTYIK